MSASLQATGGPKHFGLERTSGDQFGSYLAHEFFNLHIRDPARIKRLGQNLTRKHMANWLDAIRMEFVDIDVAVFLFLSGDFDRGRCLHARSLIHPTNQFATAS